MAIQNFKSNIAEITPAINNRPAQKIPIGISKTEYDKLVLNSLKEKVKELSNTEIRVKKGGYWEALLREYNFLPEDE